jgi:pyrroloquinoline quinone (PQQ) biosynthesis protein C
MSIFSINDLFYINISNINTTCGTPIFIMSPSKKFYKMIPERLHLEREIELPPTFKKAWDRIVQEECHNHAIWESEFMKVMTSSVSSPKQAYGLVRLWAINNLIASWSFPRYSLLLAAKAPSDFTRHLLIANAWDESGGSQFPRLSHFRMAVNLCQLFGFNKDEIENPKPLNTTKEHVNGHFQSCKNDSFEFGIGMLCLIEEMTTPEFTRILNSLTKSWENGSGKALPDFILSGSAYFTENIEADERHRLEMAEIVAANLKIKGVNLEDEQQVEKALEPVRDGMKKSIQLRHDFLEGVFREAKKLSP